MRNNYPGGRAYIVRCMQRALTLLHALQACILQFIQTRIAVYDSVLRISKPKRKTYAWPLRLKAIEGLVMAVANVLTFLRPL